MESQLAGGTQPLPRSRPVRSWLVIELILGIPATAFGAFAALMSPMLFDAPGSASNPPVLLLFGSIVAFPLMCILGIALAWIAFARHRDRGAMWLSLSPLLPILTGIGALVWFGDQQWRTIRTMTAAL